MELNPAHAAVTRALELVTLGTPVEYRGLSITPLLGDDAPAGEYVTLDEALDAGDVEITEISEDGRVPELRLKNRAVRSVLIVDGEELVGAKQNRVLNLSVLAGAQRDTIIPVSCVEAGRWRHATRQFSSSSRAHFASGRAAKVAEVSASLISEGTRRSDQGTVWEAIAAKASRMEAQSDTSAMSAIFERHEQVLEEYVAQLAAVEHQRGAVFSVHGRVAGAELFDRAAAWRRLMPKLVRSYAIERWTRGREADRRSRVRAISSRQWRAPGAARSRVSARGPTSGSRASWCMVRRW
jgi:hypothetical protein